MTTTHARLHTLGAALLTTIAITVAGCSAQQPAATTSAAETLPTVSSSPTPSQSPSSQSTPSRSTCDYQADHTVTERDGWSAMAASTVSARSFIGPPGTNATYDTETNEWLDAESGKVVHLEDAPTYTFHDDGGIQLGVERHDANGTYRQAEVPQSAEIVSSLDSWERSLPGIHDTWAKRDFYLAQDFATCVVLTWYLDNPAVVDRSDETLTAYAEAASDLIPDEHTDQWVDAVTNIEGKGKTSTQGVQRALAKKSELHPYPGSSLRFDLLTLQVREVAPGSLEQSLAFTFTLQARVPAVTFASEYSSDDVALADDWLTVAVQLDQGVPYLVALDG